MHVTILHLSDIQYGRHHVDKSSRPPLYPGNDYSNQFVKLCDDLKSLSEIGIKIDFIVVSGDLTETGSIDEFLLVEKFLEDLIRYLSLEKRSVIIVPGNHDVNRILCKSARLHAEAYQEVFNPPYFAKFNFYKQFFDKFYSPVMSPPGIPRLEFIPEKLFVNFYIPDNNLIFCGLNSCIDESELDPHYGNITNDQLNKAISEINHIDSANKYFRIAVMHHNFMRRSFYDDENLIDADELLLPLLKHSFKLILHGHQHIDKENIVGQGNKYIRVLATGSAGLDSEELPENCRRYQVIQIFKDDDDNFSYKIYKRRFDNQKVHHLGKGSWVPDVDPGEENIFLELRDLISPALDLKISPYLSDSIIRGEDILKLAFPKRKITLLDRVLDHKNKIYYEYFSIDIGHKLVINFLFVGKNITISSTLNHFLENHSLPEIGLTICTPRTKRKVIKDAEIRAKNIKDIFNDIIVKKKLKKLNNFEVFFIDQFLWKNCLDPSITSNKILQSETEIFIDQNLYFKSFIGNGFIEEDKGLCITFFEEIFKKKPEDDDSNPIHIIFGYGGVGKTTFCGKLVEIINSMDFKRAIYIKSNDLLGKIGVMESEIHSITDLFKLYDSVTGKKYASLHEPYNLEFNISCGNIIIVIDGLDEIASYLKYKFDIDLFLQSLVDLHEQFNNCKVIITSRDFQEDLFLNKKGIDVYFIKGFDDDLTDLFLKKRFYRDTNKRTKVKEYLKEFNILYEKRYNPLCISLISQIVDREKPKEPIRKIKTFNTNILKPTDRILDELIYNLIDREIEKQDLKIQIDQLIELLMEIVVEYNGNISVSDFNEYIDYTFSTKDIGKKGEIYFPFYKNPLIIYREGINEIALRYDILNTLLKARYIQKAYKENKITERIMHLLAENAFGLGPVIDELKESTEKGNIIDLTTNYVGLLLKAYRTKDNDYRLKEIIQKAISACLYYCFYVVNPVGKDECSQLLRTVYQNNLINIFIFGEFYAMDFNNLTIRDSIFIGYNNLFKSIFPKEKNVFYYCIFKDLEVKGKPHIAEEIFDETCEIPDELKFVIALDKEKSEKLYELLKSDIKKFFRNFVTANSFDEKTYNQIHIAFSTNLNKRILIDEALRYGIIGINEEKMKKEFYEINKDYYLSILTLLNQNKMEPSLEKFCVKLLTKYLRKSV